MKTIAACLLLVLTGCTSYRVTQEDTSSTGRTITLRVRADAWFSSAQSITGISAQQTDKTQTFGTKGLSQAGPTNTADLIESLAKLAAALRPTP